MDITLNAVSLHANSNIKHNQNHNYIHSNNCQSDIETNNHNNGSVVFQNVSITLQPGSVTVFVGNNSHSNATSSNASTLVKFIALQQLDGQLTGSIRYNSSKRRSGAYRDIVCVAEMGAAHFGSLTVTEYLHYCSRLRTILSVEDCNERSRIATKVVGLDSRARINSLSPADATLLTIAGELVGYPSTLCLIDPTKGLDAAGAVDVFYALHKIAKRISSLTTVVCSSPAMNTDMLRYVDRVALFLGAKVVRVIDVGRLDRSIQRQVGDVFTDISRHLSTDSRDEEVRIMKTKSELAQVTVSTISGSSNRTEQAIMRLLLDIDDLILSTATAIGEPMSASVSELEHSSSSNRQDQVKLRDDDLDRVLAAENDDGWQSSIDSSKSSPWEVRSRQPAGVPSRAFKPLIEECSILIARGWRYHLQDGTFLRMNSFRLLIAGLIIGLVSLGCGHLRNIDNANLVNDPNNNDLNNPDAYNVSSAIFLIVAISFTGIAFALPYMQSNYRILALEVCGGLHTTLAGYVSILVVEIPIVLISACIFGGLLQGLMGLTVDSFLFYFLVGFVMLCGHAMASACASWCSSPDSASIWFARWAVVCTVTTGFLQTIPFLPSFWPWITSISFTRYAFQGIMLQVFQNLTEGPAYLDTFGFDNSSSAFCLEMLIVWFVGLHIITFIGMLPNDYRRRIFSMLLFSCSRYCYGCGRTDSVDEDMNYSPMVDSADTNSSHLPKHADSESIPDSLAVPEDPRDRFAVVQILPASKVTLSFQKVKYIDIPSEIYLKSRTGYGSGNEFTIDGEEVIVQGISGCVVPGTSLCILDGQKGGAGITLLQVLAGRARVIGTVTGTIRANGSKLSRGLAYFNTGFVASGDISRTHLTVQQTLQFAALLRRTDTTTCSCTSGLWTKVDRDSVRSSDNTGESDTVYRKLDAKEMTGRSNDVDERVAEVLRIIGLSDVANYSIRKPNGDNNLTPAQLRCLTIGVELVNRPGLIFMEDPFGGLGWDDADYVGACIQTLVQGGRTIIASLPHASHRAHNFFTDTLLLGSGLMIYFGPSAKAVSYFENIGFERKDDETPLRYLMRISNDMGTMKSDIGSRRTVALNHDDLADLCRSLLSSNSSGAVQNSKSSAGINPSQGAVAPSAVVEWRKQQMLNSSSFKANSLTDDEDEDLEFTWTDSTNSDGSDINEPRANTGNNGNIIVTPPNHQRTSARPPMGLRSNATFPTISLPSDPAYGPITRVLLVRGFQQLFYDVRSLVYFGLRFLFAGIFIGTIWFNIENGDYDQRMSLFTLSYYFVNVAMGDRLHGIHERKRTFHRESANGASQFIAYWAADSSALQVANFIGSFLFTVPLYFLAGLRPGYSYFLYFYILIFASLYCNMGVAYILSFYCSSSHISRMIFNGIVLPFQLLLSGFLFLFSEMHISYSWGRYLNPMAYFLAGSFHNEFSGNEEALGEYSFSSLASYYGYHIDRTQAIVAILLLGVVYHLLLLVLLKTVDVASRKQVMKNVRDARRRAKLVLAAGIRWTGSISSGGSSTVSQASDDTSQSELKIRRKKQSHPLAAQLLEEHSAASSDSDYYAGSSSSGSETYSHSTGKVSAAGTSSQDEQFSTYKPPLVGIKESDQAASRQSFRASFSGLSSSPSLMQPSTDHHTMGGGSGYPILTGNRRRTDTGTDSLGDDSKAGVTAQSSSFSSTGIKDVTNRSITGDTSLVDVSQMPGVYVINTASNSTATNDRYTAVENAMRAHGSSSEDSSSLRESVSMSLEGRNSFGSSPQLGLYGRQLYPGLSASQSGSGSPQQVSPFLARANLGGLNNAGVHKRAPWQQGYSSSSAMNNSSPLLSSIQENSSSRADLAPDEVTLDSIVQEDILTCEAVPGEIVK